MTILGTVVDSDKCSGEVDLGLSGDIAGLSRPGAIT